MALKTILRVFGFGKHQDKKTGNNGAAAADDKTNRAQRLHPYEEVSDAVLQENRSKRPPRRHEYDEVDIARTMSKVDKKRNKEVVLQDSQRTPRRHEYDEVDLQRTMSKVNKKGNLPSSGD
ncbi:uncharacterized protein LOC143277649 [Babylonia areolata]|uniref:uncharacterized protein LOC143277649 n=1 Tax=Babylonia areolata TaxID=304850 RepID=UPI003FD68E04